MNAHTHHGSGATSGHQDVSSLRMILTMGIIGLLAGILIVVTYQVTLPIIEKNKREYLERAIFQVLPQATRKVDFIVEEDGRLIPAGTRKDRAFRVYGGYDDQGKLVGVAVEAKGQGFQDVIHIIYGYDPQCQCVVGMKVLESKETPGLGSKIETDPDFLANFKELDVRLDPQRGTLVHPIEMVKKGQKTQKWQIEAITGATISSRAITRIMQKSASAVLPIIQKNLDVLRSGAHASEQ